MKSSQIRPYLFFGGRCEEAIEFYKSRLGASVDILMRFQDNPAPSPAGMIPAGWEGKIMHATLRFGGAIIQLSDGCDPGPDFRGFSLSVNVAEAAEAEAMFAALSDGGRVGMPLGPTFWSPLFGMVTDRFGVGWMIGVGE